MMLPPPTPVPTFSAKLSDAGRGEDGRRLYGVRIERNGKFLVWFRIPHGALVAIARDILASLPYQDPDDANSDHLKKG